jgi:hypothetical protein
MRYRLSHGVLRLGCFSFVGVDVADNSGMIKLAVASAVAYYAYRQGWLSMLGIGLPATSTVSPATAAPDPNAITGANTVAGLQARVLLNAKAPAEGLPVDTWNWYLNQQLAPLGKTAPDPMPLFVAASPGFDRAQPVTAGQYWAVMTPALKSQLGLSGLGLYKWVQ